LQNGFSYSRLQRFTGNKIHFGHIQKISKVLFQFQESKKTDWLRKAYQNIHVAGFVRLISRKRAENADLTYVILVSQ